MEIAFPAVVPEEKEVPALSFCKAGTITKYFPASSMKRYGFSAINGVFSTAVLIGHFEGALGTPTYTMFHVPPVQVPTSEFLVNHCCCVPPSSLPSILQSAINPPLAQPPVERLTSPCA